MKLSSGNTKAYADTMQCGGSAGAPLNGSKRTHGIASSRPTRASPHAALQGCYQAKAAVNVWLMMNNVRGASINVCWVHGSL